MSQKPTWEKPGQDEKRLRRQLMQALSRSGVCVTLQDETSDYLFVANFLDGWTLVPGDSPDDSSLFGPKLGKELTELKTTVRETGASAEMESRVGSDRYFRFVVDPVSTEADGTDLVTTIIEISKDRKSESVRRSLLREVSHRSKNLLAIIQSIASQTARHSDTIEQFLNKFRGRLYSLSLSQDLVTDSLWLRRLSQGIGRRAGPALRARRRRSHRGRGRQRPFVAQCGASHRAGAARADHQRPDPWRAWQGRSRCHHFLRGTPVWARPG